MRCAAPIESQTQRPRRSAWPRSTWCPGRDLNPGIRSQSCGTCGECADTMAFAVPSVHSLHRRLGQILGHLTAGATWHRARAWAPWDESAGASRGVAPWTPSPAARRRADRRRFRSSARWSAVSRIQPGMVGSAPASMRACAMRREQVAATCPKHVSPALRSSWALMSAPD